jgi:hypothetical protein
MFETGSSAAFIGKVGLMALFAAIAHALNQYRTGGAKTWADRLILGFISFFFGIVTGLLVFRQFGDVYFLYGIVGVSGWMGIEMSTILKELIIKKFK